MRRIGWGVLLALAAVLAPGRALAEERDVATGVVTKIDKRNRQMFVLDPKSRHVMVLQIGRSDLVRDGERANLWSLRRGDDVRVSYELDQGEMVAREIQAASKGLPPGGSKGPAEAPKPAEPRSDAERFVCPPGMVTGGIATGCWISQPEGPCVPVAEPAGTSPASTLP